MNGKYCWRVALVAAILFSALGVVAADDLEDRIAAAQPLTIENVAAPVQSTRAGGIVWVPNPDGKTYDLLIRYYDTYWGPHTTIVLDLGDRSIHRHVVESALYQATLVGPDGKLYGHRTGTVKNTIIYVYDPATNEFRDLPQQVDVNFETRPLCIGTDGLIYGAGSLDGAVTAYQLNPATGEITEYGKLGPSHAPNQSWGYSVAADDTHVYIASGKIPWYLVAHNRQSGETQVLLTDETERAHLSVSQDRHGVTASVAIPGQPSKRYWVYRGQVTPLEDPKTPPWPVPDGSKPWVQMPPKPELGTGELIPGADGAAAVWYRMPEDKPKAGSTQPDAATPPEQLGWQVLRFQVPTYPAPLYGITALPDGRIFGSAGSYLGNVLYDPAKDEARHLGIIHLSEYCAVPLAGKVYMSGYPSGALYLYDPARPWTAGKAAAPWLNPPREEQAESNPQRISYLAHVGAGTHKMWTATVAAGKAYFGGRWYRNGEGGGLAWYDPATGEAKGISEPFSALQVLYITAVLDGKYVVASTRPVRDVTHNKPTPTAGALVVLDTSSHEVVRVIEPVPNAEFAGVIAGGKGPHVLGLTFDPTDAAHEKNHAKRSILYSIDVTTGEMAWKKTLPYPVGFLTNENFDTHDGFDFQTGPDGKVWTYTGGRMVSDGLAKNWGLAYQDGVLVRVDPATGDIALVGKVDPVGGMAFSGKDLYLSGGSKYLRVEQGKWLRRIRNIVP